MRSITLKMVLAFLGIGLVSILFVVLLTRWNTGTEFTRFVVDRRGEELVEGLANYYQTHGSWAGVDNTVLLDPNAPQPDFVLPRDPFFTLTDQSGKVIVAGTGYFLGEQISQRDMSHGVPIQVNGKTVGVMVMNGAPVQRNPREEEFIHRTNMLLLYSGLGALIVALLLGIFLSRTLTRPIRELTLATQAVSEGDLSQQVPVRSHDELGGLANSFNKMSTDLARSVNARRQMTADIAHELRTPLSLILGHADAVHDGVLPPSRENFEIIRDEAVRLEHLIDDLRTLSLADAGELRVELQEVSPYRLLNEVQSIYAHLATQRMVKIQVDAAPDLPTLEMDPARMTQVLTNILDNALRYTPEGGEIVMSASSTQDNVELSIHDSGPGIEGDDVNRIFNRFYRADASRQRNDGNSGLGLAIAKSIVEMHKGQIWAENDPAGGLNIHIRLPRTATE